MRTSLTPLVVLVACVLYAGSARADDADAAAAFEEGMRAFDGGDFGRAATAFERAWAAKHHHDASWNAARAHHRAGDSPAAANLYARYLREAPPDAKDRDRALAALKELAPLLGRIEVHASPEVDQLRIDQVAIADSEVWVNPGEHIVEGRAAQGPTRKVVVVAAGASSSVTLDASLEPPSTNPPVLAPNGEKPVEGFRIPWFAFAGGAAATAVLGGVTIWSGLDTVDQKRRFEESGTQEDLDEGRERQARTNVLLGITIGVAVITGVSALFVPWSDKKSGHRARVRLGVLTGTF